MKFLAFWPVPGEFLLSLQISFPLTTPGTSIHDDAGVVLHRMFNEATAGTAVPKYLSSDNDPPFTYHRRLANLRILEIDEFATDRSARMYFNFVPLIAALVKSQASAIPVRISRLLECICVVVALLGFTSLALWAFYDRHDRIDDAFAWVLTLLLQLHIFVTYFAWRDSGFRAEFTVSGRRER